MGKVVLVLDKMPESCYLGCPLQSEHVCGMKNETVSDFLGEKERPKWCPLKPIPEKINNLSVRNDKNASRANGFMDGFNACIDEIKKLTI